MSQTVGRKNSPLRGRNLEQDLAHKGRTFLLKGSRVKKERRTERGWRTDRRGANILEILYRTKYI